MPVPGIPVPIPIPGPARDALGLRSRVWFVPAAGLSEIRSREIALAIYRIGCDDVERGQGLTHDVVSHSAFSFEDAVSNLIAFYRHVMGYSITQIRQIAGGFEDRAQRLRIAQELLRAMDQAGVQQSSLRSTHWDRAYLFTDLCRPCQQPAGRGTRGFVLLPPQLRAVSLIDPGQSPGQGLFWRYDPDNARQRQLDRSTGRR